MKQVYEGTMAGMKMGKAVYEKTCSACHATGVAGAPKVGDKAAWAEHIAEGIEHLVQVALKGEGAMPPKGGNPALSEEEVRAAVNYMIEQSR
jgi:cytochrome c5